MDQTSAAPGGNRRFHLESNDLVRDCRTGLIWPRNAMLLEFPLSWPEALTAVADMNEHRRFGRSDWRLPNRCELRSLIDHREKRPALAAAHPFLSVYHGWYWTSTTAAIAPAYAWYVHLEGGRMFYGNKQDYYWLWPVCGTPETVLQTGQQQCCDERGRFIDCRGTGQDGALRVGVAWPDPRFVPAGDGFLDRLTGLIWHARADLYPTCPGWNEARSAVADQAEKTGRPWRLPTITELETLVDASAHSPALPTKHPFSGVGDTYWSSTTSGFDDAWAFALYLQKGAIGVGHKRTAGFSVWPVMTANEQKSYQPHF